MKYLNFTKFLRKTCDISKFPQFPHWVRVEFHNFHTVSYIYLIVYVKDAFLDFVVDLSRRIDKRLFHVGSCFGGSFHENEAVLSGKGFSFFSFDITASF